MDIAAQSSFIFTNQRNNHQDRNLDILQWIDLLTWFPSWLTRLRSDKGFSKRPMLNLTNKILPTASSIRSIGIMLFLTRWVRSSINSVNLKGTMTCHTCIIKTLIYNATWFHSSNFSFLHNHFLKSKMKFVTRATNHVNASLDPSLNRIGIVGVRRRGNPVDTFPI